MAYKIAIASSDGVNIDLSFGATLEFKIYEAEGDKYHLLETRQYILPEGAEHGKDNYEGRNGCGSENEKGCGSAELSTCGNGESCGNAKGTFPKVKLISDCRCVICKNIGFNIQKQLEKLAISGFDVDCTVEEALIKIVTYFDKIDNHKSLRKI